ncbi:MAG TPA: 2-dehydropantoate 2-reductase, partial [Candidatus Hodarchaeales archaeon]|nr:2-dehydropantoate 2-reductase [Candidatus Hodarchaeales archaeon]
MIDSILVYGAGSIGSLYAGHLSFGGSKIALIGRDPHVEVCSSKGLAIFDVTSNKQLTTDPIIAFPTLDALRQEVEINPDVIIVSCKAYDNEFAAEDLERILGEDSSIKIVLLQNGVGNEEVFYEKFP